MRVWTSGACGSTWPALPPASWQRSVGVLGRLWAGPPQPRPWGEGLVDQSLSTLFYRASWEDADRDELVFLLPSLRHGSRLHQPRGAGLVFHDALSEWTHRAALASDAAIAGAVLLIIEKLYGLAVGNATDTPLTTEEAMTGAVYARINSAYADPRLEHLHEPLMVAAWIGHLVAGRDALLPPIIAAPLASLIAAGLSSSSQVPDPAATVVVHYATAAGGAHHLARMAAKVSRSGHPRLVRSAMPAEPVSLERASSPLHPVPRNVPAHDFISGD